MAAAAAATAVALAVDRTIGSANSEDIDDNRKQDNVVMITFALDPVEFALD